MRERLTRLFRPIVVRGVAFLLPLLLALPAWAVTDRRAVRGAAAAAGSGDTGPAIPEPSSILLYAAGVAIVGFGFHKFRNRRP